MSPFEKSFKISAKGKMRLMRIIAGLTAVIASPFISAGIAQKAASFTTFVSSAVESNIKTTDNAVPLLMNSEALLLYKPSGGSLVVTEQISLLNFTDVETETEAENLFYNSVLPVMSLNITDESEDLSEYTSRDGEIVKKTFTSNGGTKFINLNGGGQIRNETELTNEEILEEISKNPDFTISKNGEPEVLIIHTHASEAYQPTDSGYYDSDYISRSIDADNNVVAVGSEIAQSIAELGIAVIHDGTMHDIPEYNGAYNRSAETVKTLLREFPSIKVVLDIHRDAIAGADDTIVSPVADINGEDAAQIMIISAADDGNYGIPEFRQNLRFAALLQSQIESDNAGITRPVLFQYCQYNQHLSTGSLLIEVGANGNTIEQAKLSGRIIGASIGKALLSLSQ